MLLSVYFSNFFERQVRTVTTLLPVYSQHKSIPLYPQAEKGCADGISVKHALQQTKTTVQQISQTQERAFRVYSVSPQSAKLSRQKLYQCTQVFINGLKAFSLHCSAVKCFLITALHTQCTWSPVKKSEYRIIGSSAESHFMSHQPAAALLQACPPFTEGPL